MSKASSNADLQDKRLQINNHWIEIYEQKIAQYETMIAACQNNILRLQEERQRLLLASTAH